MKRLLATLATAALLTGACASAAAAAEDKIGIGVFLHNSYKNPSLYDAYTDGAGHPPAIIGSYKAWSLPAIDRPRLDAIWNRGAVPMVTWEPWGDRGKVFRLYDISHGRYDRYIRHSARDAAAWGKPIFFRFAHEMNGAWYPWGRGTHGNTPAAYKNAWRRIVRLFRVEGATNVRWVWCPNQNFSGRFPFRQYYPGDRWVDWAGLDGFNWARSPGWQSLDEIFAGSYNALLRFTDRPIMIAETGSWERRGDKGLWVSSALERELPAYEHVRAFLWWSVSDSRGDLRVNSSGRALAALRTALSLPIYDATREDVLAVPDSLGSASALPIDSSGSVAGKVRRELRENYAWVGYVAFGVCLLGLLLAMALHVRRRPPQTTPPGQDAPPL